MSLKNFSVLGLVLFLFCLTGCNITENERPNSKPVGKAILVALFGNSSSSGFWFFNADSLTVIDSIYTQEGRIGYIDVDSNKESIYWIDGSVQKKINTYNLTSKSKSAVNTRGINLKVSSDGEYILTYKNYEPGLSEIYDSEDMNIVASDSLGRFLDVFTIPDTPIFYAVVFKEEGESQQSKLVSLNQESLQIENEVLLDFISFSRFYDMGLSHDAKYFFLSNTDRSGAFGNFVVYDLEARAKVNEFETGPYPTFSISPDGENIYITSRRSVNEITPKKIQVLHYDIIDKQIEVIIDDPKEIGLEGQYVESEHVLVSPDGKSIYLAPGNKDIATGKYSNILQFDVENKRVVNSYEIPRDSLGRYSTFLLNMGLVETEN